MAVFEIEAPDGQTYEVEGATAEGAFKALRSHLGSAAPQTEKSFSERLSTAWENPHPAGLMRIVKGAAEAITGKNQVPPGLRREDVTDIPGTAQPIDKFIGNVADLAAVTGVGAPRGTGGAFAVPRTAPAPPTAARPAAQAGTGVIEAGQRQGMDLARLYGDETRLHQIAPAAANMPGVGTPIRQAIEATGRELSEGVGRIAGDTLPEEAGQVLSGAAQRFIKQGAKEEQGPAWNQFRGQLDAATQRMGEHAPIGNRAQLSNTERVIAEFTAEAANSGGAPGAAVKMVADRIANMPRMDYDGMAKLTRDVGSKFGRDFEVQGFTTQEVRALYKSLKKDTEALLNELDGPGLVQNWKHAVRQSASTNSARRALERLSKGENLTPEGLFHRAALAAGQKSKDAGLLLKIKRAIPEAYEAFQSAKLRSLGRENPKVDFSPGAFVSSWGRLNSTFKGLMDPAHKAALDDFAIVAKRQSELETKLMGGSQTAQRMLGPAVVADLIVTGGVMTILKGGGLGYLGARWLAQPVGAKAVAKWAKTMEQAQKMPPNVAGPIMEKANRALALTVAPISGDKPALIFQKLQDGTWGLRTPAAGDDKMAMLNQDDLRQQISPMEQLLRAQRQRAPGLDPAIPLSPNPPPPYELQTPYGIPRGVMGYIT